MSDRQSHGLAGIYLRGLAMGVADLIPGVSGGTVALVTGIYDRLVGAIASLGLPALRLLLKRDLRGFWRHVDGSFLVALFAGIGTSVLTLAGLLHRLLESVPQLVWALFLGLILASILHMIRIVRGWTPPLAALVLAGAACAWWLTQQAGAEVDESAPWIVACGMLAITAWILPGISGSFVLLALGMYAHIIGAIRALDIQTLLLFGSGCAGGLILFTHLLRWALSRYHAAIMALLTGFLCGSLPLLWPWQGLPRSGPQPELLLPQGYLAATGREPLLLGCLGLVAAGFLMVVLLEILSTRRDS